MSGDGTWIHRIGYQAMCVIEEDIIRIRGEIFWSPELRNSANDRLESLNGILAVRSGRMKNITPSDSPAPFGNFVWEAFSNGTILDITRWGEGWVATYEILNLPVLTPIIVLVDVRPGFGGGRTDIGPSRVGGPDPVMLSGNVPEVDGVNFELRSFPGVG